MSFSTHRKLSFREGGRVCVWREEGGGRKEEKGREKEEESEGVGKTALPKWTGRGPNVPTWPFSLSPLFMFPLERCVCMSAQDGRFFVLGLLVFSPFSLFFSSLSLSCSQFLWRIDLKSPGEFPV